MSALHLPRRRPKEDRSNSWRAAISARAENVASAFQAIHQQKLRSFLTCLGIIIGVSTVILMVALIQGFNSSIVADFQRFGSTLVQFQRHDDRFGPPELTPEELEQLKLTGLRFCQPVIPHGSQNKSADDLEDANAA